MKKIYSIIIGSLFVNFSGATEAILQKIQSRLRTDSIQRRPMLPVVNNEELALSISEDEVTAYDLQNAHQEEAAQRKNIEAFVQEQHVLLSDFVSSLNKKIAQQEKDLITSAKKDKLQHVSSFILWSHYQHQEQILCPCSHK